MSNAPATEPKKRKTPKTAWKKGQSGNPAGPPKRGESWVEAIEKVGNMTPLEIIRTLGGHGELARQFKQFPQAIPMKVLVTMRIFGALMFEPSPGLFNAVMDRVEGKPKQPITGADDEPLKIVVEYVSREIEAAGTDGAATDDQA